MTAGSAPIRPELQAFVDARNRPAMFFFTDSPMWRPDVIAMHEEVRGRRFEEIDLVIHSGGGSIHAAYQVVELLRLHSKRLNACVPFWAKSAATLLCLGADEMRLTQAS